MQVESSFLAPPQRLFLLLTFLIVLLTKLTSNILSSVLHEGEGLFLCISSSVPAASEDLMVSQIPFSDLEGSTHRI